MAPRTDSTPEQRQAFALALTHLIDENGITRKALAERLAAEYAEPVDASTVSNWCNAKHEPRRIQVLALEHLLQVPAGTLTQLLGYTPTDATPPTTTVDAIAQDLTLTADQRADLIRQYEAMVERTAARRQQRRR